MNNLFKCLIFVIAAELILSIFRKYFANTRIISVCFYCLYMLDLYLWCVGVSSAFVLVVIDGFAFVTDF